MRNLKIDGKRLRDDIHDTGTFDAIGVVTGADGPSYNELESASLEACAAGAQVLPDAVLRYEERLAGGGL